MEPEYCSYRASNFRIGQTISRDPSGNAGGTGTVTSEQLRTAYRNTGLRQQLSLGTQQKYVPFRRVRMVGVFSGWDESLTACTSYAQMRSMRDRLNRASGVLFSSDLTEVALGPDAKPIEAEVRKWWGVPVDAVVRRFEAETGTLVLGWQYVGTFETSRGICDMFLARAHRPLLARLDATLRWYALEEARQKSPLMNWLLPFFLTYFQQGSDWWRENVGNVSMVLG